MEKIRRFKTATEEYLQKPMIFSDMEFMEKMKIFRVGKPTYAAYLMFAKNFCSISDVQIGRFRTPTIIADSLSLDTDLFSEVEEIYSYPLGSRPRGGYEYDCPQGLP